MSELIPLLASNVMGLAAGYLVARLSRPSKSPSLPNIEPQLDTPLVMYPKKMTAHEAARWLRRMAGELEAKERKQEGDDDAH
ncbi:hypothetical protein [Vreelandella titanicae]|uniref:hypothetical protein n=1 Tax=Vreelandella titanicae TaxID=664683 RepID=UPI00404413CC